MYEWILVTIGMIYVLVYAIVRLIWLLVACEVALLHEAKARRKLKAQWAKPPKNASEKPHPEKLWRVLMRLIRLHLK